MPLINSSSPSAFSKNLKSELAAGKPKNQSLAIAYKVQRKHMASGGAASPPFYVRSEAHNLEHSGMIHSPIAGRTDRLPMGVKSGAYVFPADVVSGLGQGNSLSGAHALSQMLKMGPYGSGATKIGASRAPHYADGGATESDGPPVDIVAAGGEFVAPPEAVAQIGNGDIKHGHEVLDAFVKHVRKKTIKTLRKLPAPKKK